MVSGYSASPISLEATPLPPSLHFTFSSCVSSTPAFQWVFRCSQFRTVEPHTSSAFIQLLSTSTYHIHAVRRSLENASRVVTLSRGGPAVTHGWALSLWKNTPLGKGFTVAGGARPAPGPAQATLEQRTLLVLLEVPPWSPTASRDALRSKTQAVGGTGKSLVAITHSGLSLVSGFCKAAGPPFQNILPAKAQGAEEEEAE